MNDGPVDLASLSAAMDGGFTAIADVAAAMAASGTTDQHRLIGGVAVMLHIERLRLDLPLRATGDADFGVPPHVLRRPELVDAIEARGYGKVAGNRWERQIDGLPGRRFFDTDMDSSYIRSPPNGGMPRIPTGGGQPDRPTQTSMTDRQGYP